MTGTYRTIVKRSSDLGLSHVKKALINKENPLSRLELDFIRTSCRILDINSEDTIKGIVKRAIDKGGNQPKRVMASLRAQLDDLGTRAENHKRPTPTPALATRTYDNMDAQSGAPATLCERTEGCHGRGVFQGDQDGQDSNGKCNGGL
jgi:hypothetical protein